MAAVGDRLGIESQEPVGAADWSKVTTYDAVAGRPEAGAADPRVQIVLEVLGGASAADVAQRWAVEVVLVDQWVRSFVVAGSRTVGATGAGTPAGTPAGAPGGPLLRAFAHELRRPLVTARGWAAVLQDDAMDPQVTEGALEELLDTLRRISDRVVDVELVADGPAEPLALRPSSISVGDLVAGLDGLDELTGPGAEVLLHVDAGLFRRALRDLWAAGLGAPPPASVRLDIALLPAWLELRVVREGEPISTERLAVLLGPVTVQADGSGLELGLALARIVARAHGGDIGADQTGEGSVLWLRIPRNSAATS